LLYGAPVVAVAFVILLALERDVIATVAACTTMRPVIWMGHTGDSKPFYGSFHLPAVARSRDRRFTACVQQRGESVMPVLAVRDAEGIVHRDFVNSMPPPPILAWRDDFVRPTFDLSQPGDLHAIHRFTVTPSGIGWLPMGKHGVKPSWSTARVAAVTVRNLAADLEFHHDPKRFFAVTTGADATCPASFESDGGGTVIAGRRDVTIPGTGFHYTLDLLDADGDGRCERYVVRAVGTSAETAGQVFESTSDGEPSLHSQPATGPTAPAARDHVAPASPGRGAIPGDDGDHRRGTLGRAPGVWTFSNPRGRRLPGRPKGRPYGDALGCCS
jgi:hypothetical protein